MMPVMLDQKMEHVTQKMNVKAKVEPMMEVALRDTEFVVPLPSIVENRPRKTILILNPREARVDRARLKFVP